MADGFVVLQSYVDSIELLPEDRRWAFFKELFAYRMTGAEPQPQSELEQMALVNIFPVIDRSVERYTANKENGAKGGRPKKWIPPEEWMEYYKAHGRKATAEHFGVPEETLKKWISTVGKKGKNQDIDKDKDMDMDSDKDIHINIINKKEKNNKKEKEDRETLKGVPAPLKPKQNVAPCQPGYEFVNKGILYRFNERREVVEVGAV